MKPPERNIDDVLKQTLPSAPRGQMDAALDRVHARLRSDSEPRVFAPRDSRPSTSTRTWQPAIRMAAAAAVVIAAIWGATSFRDPGVYAVLEAADGSMYRIAGGQHVPIHVGDRIAAQEIVRADGQTGAVLALADGSRVEMRSMSELSWDHATDGLKIRLDVGSIIVNAAKQASGRLYVQTRGMTAAVTGTTSLVNAADDGFRVAAIEGEVDVRGGTTERKLRPGQQVTTSATLAARPLINDIAWSRNDDVRTKILAIFNKNFAETSGPLQPLNYVASPAQAGQERATAASPQFEEASIRQCDPDTVPLAPPGARGGGANSFYMSPGRTYVLCMTLATIIRTAFHYGPYDILGTDNSVGPAGRGLSTGPVFGLGVEDGRRVRGGPDWIRDQRYTIEAVAEGTADGEAMSGPMLRALLEKRFQLKAHVETEQAPAFDLTVARGGLKIKPVDPATACEAGRPPDVPAIRIRRTFKDVRNGQKPSCGLGIQTNGPNRVLVGGAATFQALANVLGGPFNLGVRVFDKTGIAGTFNFVLEILDESPPERRLVLPDPDNHPKTAADVPPAANIFRGIEEQLGLTLVPSKASRPFVVIDHVERPSAN
jgi:uncharacterized protein (TIGR03435 family)